MSPVNNISAIIDERAMMHGRDWTGEFCDGWLVTEKFNGVRAYWDGLTLWTRGGKPVPLPPRFACDFPRGIALDGEIWAGYGHSALDEANMAARYGRFTTGTVFKVFDAPAAPGGWKARLLAAQVSCGEQCTSFIELVHSVPLLSLQHLADAYEAVRLRGGEGLVLRDPDARYLRGRSHCVLKFKAEQYRQLIAEFPHLAENDN